MNAVNTMVVLVEQRYIINTSGTSGATPSTPASTPWAASRLLVEQGQGRQAEEPLVVGVVRLAPLGVGVVGLAQVLLVVGVAELAQVLVKPRQRSTPPTARPPFSCPPTLLAWLGVRVMVGGVVVVRLKWRFSTTSWKSDPGQLNQIPRPWKSVGPFRIRKWSDGFQIEFACDVYFYCETVSGVVTKPH